MNKSKLVSLFILFFVLLNISCTTLSYDDLTNQCIGVILDRVVNIRIKPDISSRIVSTVKENEHVKIIKLTKQKVEINGFTDKWVKIITRTGKVGYIFGAFLFDLKELYTKWYLSLETGEEGDIKLTISKNNTWVENSFIEHSPYRKRYKASGKIYILGRKIKFSINRGKSYFSRNKAFVKYLYKFRSKYYLVDKPLSLKIKFNSVVNENFPVNSLTRYYRCLFRSNN